MILPKINHSLNVSPKNADSTRSNSTKTDDKKQFIFKHWSRKNTLPYAANLNLIVDNSNINP